MKSIFKFLFSVLVIASLGVMYSCSSSSNDDASMVDIDDSYLQPNNITGIYKLGNYTLSFYDNNTFEATDENSNFSGVYCYSDPILSLSGISNTTRAFNIEVGKIYTYEVTRNGNDITLKDENSGETYIMTYAGTTTEQSDKLTADQEKMFIETTARTFEHFLVADEMQEYADIYKELKDVKKGDLDDFIKNYTVETLLNSQVDSTYYAYKSSYYDYNTWVSKPLYYIYNYITTTNTYDKVITLTNIQGQYEAVAGGSWRQTGRTGDLKLTYTAQDGSQWVLAVTHEGSTGDFTMNKNNSSSTSSRYTSVDRDTIPEGDSICSYTYYYTNNNKTTYYNVPTKAIATLTHNGDTRVSINVNVNKFDIIKDKTLSLIGQCNGNATVEIKTTGDPFKVTSVFNYANGTNSTANALLTKGTKILLKAEASATPSASSNTNLSNVTASNATITILNSLTVKASFSNGKTIYDAYNNARSSSNRYDGSTVQNYIDIINDGLTAYFFNKPESDVIQGRLKAKMTSKDETYWTYSYVDGKYTSTSQTRKRYYVNPALSFDDGTSYIFDDYFTESFFQKVVDYAKNLRDNLENMTK